jgi:hypothetical protein
MDLALVGDTVATCKHPLVSHQKVELINVTHRITHCQPPSVMQIQTVTVDGRTRRRSGVAPLS